VRVHKHDVTTHHGHSTATTMRVQGTPTLIVTANNAELARTMGSPGDLDLWVRRATGQ
jgi:hypothetical protein